GDLVRVLIDTWQLDRALELADQLPPAIGPDRTCRVFIHLDLAWGCILATRRPEGQRQLACAQALIGTGGSDLARTHRDVLELCLATNSPGSQALSEVAPRARAVAEGAERLSRTAVDADARRSAAEAACRGWLALYVLSGEGCDEGERIAALAEEHNLPGWQFHAKMHSALLQLENAGDCSLLCTVHAQAEQLGMVGQALLLETNLRLEQVQLADGSLAPVLAGLTGCLEQARRLRNASMERYALYGLVLAAGYRADRVTLAEAVARYESACGDSGPAGMPTVRLASAVCLALEGRDGEALATLQDPARQHVIGTNDSLSLPFALAQLLSTLAGTSQPAEVAAALGTAGRRRWCRQFLHAAAAVQAGREGNLAKAEQHAEQARAAAGIYPVTRHLIARLVAPAAAADGWGSPIEDLRAAEAWFHEQGVAPAARSCRDVLRALGVPVPQRRDGIDAVPAELRALGVPVREYEVSQLVTERLGNRAIGERLHISPRTVEKHIAALTGKLAVPDRQALIGRLADTRDRVPR
ncbi:MAG TPA: LuxR C-terminal-related transcriptional regulator, partial [Jatrophihabitans sp.]|nr:LuxR C-terminal-related transcriptional regulator [Jatrophihabitans sp.]